MSQALIDRNPQDNPRLNEIYEILLLAGYFRIRIASLKAFDKIVGGLAWCITSSNFQIEVEYNDEMQIGQKIKVSQIVCDSLKKMKCPYSLQPFQLQGLDINNIFPIVQWLVKFVFETRFERQKYDRQLSMILGKPITKLQSKGNADKIMDIKLQRTRINRAIQKTNHRNPIRIYSALLEYNDATAAKIYNKLLNIMANKGRTSKGGSKQVNGQAIADLLGEQNELQDMKQQANVMNQFGNFKQKLSLQKLEKIIQQNKTSIEEGVVQHDIEQDLINQLSSTKTDGGDDLNKQQQINIGTNQDQRYLKQLKNENKKYQQKIEILKNQYLSFETISAQLDSEIQAIKSKHEEAQYIATSEIQKNNQYKQAETEMKQQIQTMKSKVNPKLEKLVEKRQMLKNKKGDLKKKAKARIDELNEKLRITQASLPEVDQQALKQMLSQANKKKQIYDKKYEELTLINQQLAVLQRKSQNYTSPPQIAQYHQRFVELFQAINGMIEEKRNMFSEIGNLQSLKKVIANFNEILKNTKDGYSSVKKKAQLKDFNEDIKQIVTGLQTNMKNSQSTLAKIKSKRQSVYSEYMDLIKLERDYLHVLRLLKIEYENAAKMYN